MTDEDEAAMLWHEVPLPLRTVSLNDMAKCNPDMDAIKAMYREGEDSLFAYVHYICIYAVAPPLLPEHPSCLRCSH